MPHLFVFVGGRNLWGKSNLKQLKVLFGRKKMGLACVPAEPLVKVQ
jgi:hypothetical protein